MSRNLDRKYEEEKLEEKLRLYKEVMEYTELMLRRLPETYRHDPVLLSNLMAQNQNGLRLMKDGLSKPYFARIDFKSDDEQAIYECYLGKVGVTDYDNKVVIVDWRAPIAAMYYDSNIGVTSYEAPDGVITGELQVKRQIDIEYGKLIEFRDVDTVSNDDILQPYLGVSAENRLKNIVATIQGEQNKIIRAKLGENLIVQGVAGSGKTTVALHRIAHLAYNYKDKIRTDQYMVIGPNRFFLDYISNVLPDLDASTVVQQTFTDFVQEFIEEDLQVKSSEQQLVASLESGMELPIPKFKNSLQYKELLDKYLEDLDSRVVPDKPFTVRGVEILPAEVLKQVYYEEISKDQFPTIESRIERATLLLSAYISRSEKIQGRISSEALSAPKTTWEFLRKELRNNFNQSIKQWLKKAMSKSVTTLYGDFVKNIGKYASDVDPRVVSELKSTTVANLKDKTVEFDDLAGIAYLQHCISGSKDYSGFRHVVVDEAQDFGDFNFLVMKQVLDKSTFSIYGDLAQSIYSYRSIDNWDSVAKVFDGNIQLEELSKSYRTTIEVMEEANNITQYLGLTPATPVIRHGEEVGYEEVGEGKYEKMYNYVGGYIERGHNSIAVICKTNDEAQQVQQELVTRGLLIDCVISSDQKFNGGICATTAYLSKGLEFDAVLISNASEELYSSQKPNEMKQLYVAMTRAMHELNVLHEGELTKPLAGSKKKLDSQQKLVKELKISNK